MYTYLDIFLVCLYEFVRSKVWFPKELNTFSNQKGVVFFMNILCDNTLLLGMNLVEKNATYAHELHN